MSQCDRADNAKFLARVLQRRTTFAFRPIVIRIVMHDSQQSLARIRRRSDTENVSVLFPRYRDQIFVNHERLRSNTAPKNASRP